MVPSGGEGRGLLVDGLHSPRPVDPPRGIHRQPRAVCKYWARLRRVAFGDVPVNMQLKILQLIQYENVEPFIDRVLVFPAFPQRRVRTVQIAQKTGDSMLFIDKCLVETVQKTVEIPQLGSLLRPSLCNDKCLVDVPVTMMDKFQQFSTREGSKLCRKP